MHWSALCTRFWCCACTHGCIWLNNCMQLAENQLAGYPRSRRVKNQILKHPTPNLSHGACKKPRTIYFKRIILNEVSRIKLKSSCKGIFWTALYTQHMKADPSHDNPTEWRIHLNVGHIKLGINFSCIYCGGLSIKARLMQPEILNTCGLTQHGGKRCCEVDLFDGVGFYKFAKCEIIVNWKKRTCVQIQ